MPVEGKLAPMSRCAAVLAVVCLLAGAHAQSADAFSKEDFNAAVKSAEALLVRVHHKYILHMGFSFLLFVFVATMLNVFTVLYS